MAREPERRAQLRKEVYRRLRARTCAELWTEDVTAFERATPRERVTQVAVVRAVGVVFARAGTVEQRAAARVWLRGLLTDGEEKVRRYAATALAGLGAEPDDERALLACLRRCTSERERKEVADALAKVGGPTTLADVEGAMGAPSGGTARRVKARLAREAGATELVLAETLEGASGLRVHLRGRRGYEEVVAEEVRARGEGCGGLRVRGVRDGVVEVQAQGAISLTGLHGLRCFDQVGFVVGSLRAAGSAEAEAVAQAIASPSARQILRTWTRGPIRYRVEFAGRGHQRAAVRAIADRAYALWPELLNDPRQAPWTVWVYPIESGGTVELVPSLTPDPRVWYREGDVPAASHPRLAACMARLGGPLREAVVWDPFCGSGMELVECAVGGGVRRVVGSDVDARAVAVCKRNFAAAGQRGVASEFLVGDFREVLDARGELVGRVDLLITNPPMGRRVRAGDVSALVKELMTVATRALRKGGKLVLPNPVCLERGAQGLELVWRRVVDFGGFDCWLEVYRRS